MNCKPGDLAIVIRSRTPRNVGKIVQVISHFVPADSPVVPLDNAGVIWLCRTAGGDLTWQSPWGIAYAHHSQGPIPDACLRPLPPEGVVHDSCAGNDVVVQPQCDFVAA